jgi:F0F1-type ATP synthase assembly protein I
MAKVQQTQKKPIRKKAKETVVVMPEKMNYIILLLGVLVLFVGYLLMWIGGVDDALSLVISPIILMIGYCVIIPFGIMYRRKTADKVAV